LREYELVMVIDPEADEERVTATVDRVSQFVTTRGGEMTEVNHWGRRKLAYPIKKHLEGNYIVTHFRLGPSQTAELEAGLRLSEEVLRHLLVKSEE
jgi:small subunit ribosomal protein S6